jgi:hypothetical protein
LLREQHLFSHCHRQRLTPRCATPSQKHDREFSSKYATIRLASCFAVSRSSHPSPFLDHLDLVSEQQICHLLISRKNIFSRAAQIRRVPAMRFNFLLEELLHTLLVLGKAPLFQGSPNRAAITAGVVLPGAAPSLNHGI